MGYPEPTDPDLGSGFRKSGPAKMTPDEARAVMDGLQLDIRVHIIPGWFEDTLLRAQLPPVALLHLDVVLHDSYRTCLEHLYPHVVPGGVVLFDEYRDETCERYPGVKRAIDAFLAEHGLTIQKEA